MQPEIKIAGRRIGVGHPPYIICELSGNHNGSLDRALSMIEAAAATGCDAIKIQTYTPDSLTIDCDAPDFRIQGGLWDGRTLYDLYAEAHTPLEWHQEIFKKAQEVGITLFSTPFDEAAADVLDRLGAPAFKIASFEAIDLGLIAHVAKKKKPMIISTGLANLSEIEQAVSTAKENGCEELALLHCISSYPAPTEDANVRTIPHLADAFGVVAGLSDHTQGTAVSVAAIAVGASIIEKHFTLARSDGGPDAAFSLEPDEFRRLCEDCRAAYMSLGRVTYTRKFSEEKNIVFRRSLYVTVDAKAGEPLTIQNIRSIRPGYGLAPKHLGKVLKGYAARDLKRGEALDWSMIKGI